MKTIYGGFNGNANGGTFQREHIWVGHTVDGRMIIHMEDDIDGIALVVDRWEGTEQDQFDNGVREATDDLVNTLMHCETVTLVTETWSGHILANIDGKKKYRIIRVDV